LGHSVEAGWLIGV